MRNSDTRPAQDNVYCVEDPSTSPEWKKAEAFRLTGIYVRAAKYFRTVWDENKDPQAGWRYAHCLRKTGYNEPALGLLQELHKTYGDEVPELQDEYVWTLYESRLVRAKEEGNASDIVAAAKDMVAAGAEGNALKLAVFAVISAAKTKGQWNQVSCWCDLLDPEELSDRARSVNGKSIPSDKERWYFGKLKALVKQEDWHQARGVAKRACDDFPGNESFLRWNAHAMAGLGQVREAVDLLERIGPEVPWYALADLAKYSLQLEDVERAWKLAVDAARAPGQPTAKVNLWELMASIALALDRSDASLYHLALALRIRQEKDWPLRPHHRGLIQSVRSASANSELPDQPSKRLLQDCRAYWSGEAPVKPKTSENPAVAPGQGEGRVMGFDEKRPFAFIEPSDGSEQIFVLTKDLPNEVHRNRATVRYQTIFQFDKRKNRQSLRAVEITPLEAPPEEW